MTASQWLSDNLADVIVAIAQANATLTTQSRPTVAVPPPEVSPNE